MTKGTNAPKRWQCMVCGYIHEGVTPPKQCPKCGAPAEEFVLLKNMVGHEQDTVYDTLLDNENVKTGDNGGRI